MSKNVNKNNKTKKKRGKKAQETNQDGGTKRIGRNGNNAYNKSDIKQHLVSGFRRFISL